MDLDASVETYQVGAHFEALDKGVLLVPLDSRNIQVRLNIMSVQVWNRCQKGKPQVIHVEKNLPHMLLVIWKGDRHWSLSYLVPPLTLKLLEEKFQGHKHLLQPDSYFQSISAVQYLFLYLLKLRKKTSISIFTFL